MCKFRRGFTLIETLITVAISTVVMASVLAMMITARRIYSTAEAQFSLQQFNRITFRNMLEEMRQADSINVVNRNKIKFQVPIDADADGNIDYVPGTSMVIYGAEGVAGNKIEYKIQRVVTPIGISRNILDTSDNVITSKILFSNINTNTSKTFFTDIDGAYNNVTTEKGVIVAITLQKKSLDGVVLQSPLELRLRTAVRLKN